MLFYLVFIIISFYLKSLPAIYHKTPLVFISNNSLLNRNELKHIYTESGTHFGNADHFPSD